MALAPPSNPETGTSEGTYQGPGTMVETSLGSSRSNPGPATVPLVASLREMPLSSSFTAVPTGTRSKNELEPTGTSTGMKKSLVLGGTFSAGAATAGAGTLFNNNHSCLRSAATLGLTRLCTSDR
jgi:hypothetical protein